MAEPARVQSAEAAAMLGVIRDSWYKNRASGSCIAVAGTAGLVAIRRVWSAKPGIFAPAASIFLGERRGQTSQPRVFPGGASAVQTRWLADYSPAEVGCPRIPIDRR